MDIKLQNSNFIPTGRNSLWGGGLLKSTAQKLERQATRDRQVAFFENQKQNLKSIKCSSPEEVGRVLELLHSYEDQIAAVKAEYNNAQMFHMLDEAKEKGEEIAKAIKKSEPKTEEERKEEAVKEALGIEDESGLLDDILDKAAREELAAALEDAPDAPDTNVSLDQEPTQATELPADEIPVGEIPTAGIPTAALSTEELTSSQPQKTIPEPPVYKRFDAFA